MISTEDRHRKITSQNSHNRQTKRLRAHSGTYLEAAFGDRDLDLEADLSPFLSADLRGDTERRSERRSDLREAERRSDLRDAERDRDFERLRSLIDADFERQKGGSNSEFSLRPLVNDQKML